MASKTTKKWPNPGRWPNLDKIATWRSKGDLFYLCMTCRYCISETYEFLDGERENRFDFPAKYMIICPPFDIKQHEAFSSYGKVEIARILYEGKSDITEEMLKVIYSCSLCGACDEECFAAKRTKYYDMHNAEPSPYLPTDIFHALRRDLANLGVGPLSRQKEYSQWILKEHNPYYEKHTDRLNWVPEDKRESITSKSEAEYIYFVGCTTSYRQKNIAEATLKIFDAAGIDYTIMYPDEWCCGSPAYMVGLLDVADEQMKHNIEAVEKTGAKYLITSCAGCYRMWKQTYPERSKETLPVKVVHTVELLPEWIKNGRLQLNKPINLKVTYHDPCHLGRHLKEEAVYDQPRETLKSIPGIELIEMPRIKKYAYCCAHGGGYRSVFGEDAIEIAGRRLDEAMKLGVDAITSACPFCYRGFMDAIDKRKYNLKLYDVVELVAQSL